jgi:hypothetical protein
MVEAARSHAKFRLDRLKVIRGTIAKTAGGLTRNDLVFTKDGRWVSRAKHEAGKRAYKAQMKDPDFVEQWEFEKGVLPKDKKNRRRNNAATSPKRSATKKRRAASPNTKPSLARRIRAGVSASVQRLGRAIGMR